MVKVGLALLTLVLLISQIGFLLLPLLVPAHYWAATQSGRIGRIGWSFLPAAGLATSAWAVTYLMVDEAQPAIWLAPSLVLAAGFVLVFRLSGRTAVSAH